MENGLGCPSPSSGEAHSPDGAVESCVDDLDIESLLQANLGAVNITDFLNISGSENQLLPTDLPDLSVLEEAHSYYSLEASISAPANNSLLLSLLLVLDQLCLKLL